jgi:2-dehydro-3-deoxyglucarate aldolase/4-hydroxy-2-oxoheptanedioate aldolase
MSKPLLFAQIEDVEGVLHVDEIAAATGVDVLFVGPADLKLSLKYDTGGKDDTGGLSYEAAIERVAHASITNKKKAGILLRDKAQLGSVRKLGYTCIAVDSDIAILRTGYQQIIKCLTQGDAL